MVSYLTIRCKRGNFRLGVNMKEWICEVCKKINAVMTWKCAHCGCTKS